MLSLPEPTSLIESTVAGLSRQEAISVAEVDVILSPYRICPLGAHVDHQGGVVLGRTIRMGTVLAFAPLAKREIRLHSPHFGDASFSLGQLPDPRHWARYAQAAVLALEHYHPLKTGLVGWVDGTLIGVGLSSSASVGLAYLLALATVNGISLQPTELVELDRLLENEFLGLQNGILDPATIVYGQPDTLLQIDTQSGSVTYIPDPDKARCAAWLVVYSGVSRQLTLTSFNQRVSECRAAASMLLAGAQRLVDVPCETFYARQDVLPRSLRKRAAHYFSEIERVRAGRQAWIGSDLEAFGELMNASCESSINLYECGSIEIVHLQKIVSTTPGVYGSRFNGGGYGGCVVAFVQKDALTEVRMEIYRQYVTQHPELAERAAMFVVETDCGLSMQKVR